MAQGDDDVSVTFGAEGITRIAEAFKTIEASARRAAEVQIASGKAVAEAEVAAEVRKQAVRQAAHEAIKQANREAADAKKKAAKEAAEAEIGEVQRVVDAHRKAAKEAEKARRYEAEYAKITGTGSHTPGVMQAVANYAQGQGQKLSRAWDEFDAVSSAASAALGLFRSGLDLAVSALTHFGQFLISDVVVPQAKLQTTAAQLANRMDDVKADEVQGTLNAMAEQYAAFKPEDIQKAFESAVDATHNMGDASLVANLALKNATAYKLDPGMSAEFIGAKRREFKDLDPKAFSQLMSAEMQKTLKGGMRLDEMGKYADRLDGFLSKMNAPTIEAKASNDLALTALLSKASEKLGAKKSIGAVDALFKDMQATAGTDKIGQLHDAIPKMLMAVGGDISKLGKKDQSTEVKGLSKASVELLRQLGVGDVYKDAESKQKGSGGQAVTDYIREMMGSTGDEAKKVQEAFDKVDSTPMVEFNRTVEEVKAAFYPLVNDVLKKLSPIMATEGPKLAKAIADLVAGIKADDVVAGIKGVAQAFAGLAYYIMDFTGVGTPEAKAKVGALAGITEKKLDGVEADKALHPEKYEDTAGSYLATGMKYLSEGASNDSFGSGELAVNKNVGKSTLVGDVMKLTRRKMSEGGAGGGDDGGLVDAFRPPGAVANPGPDMRAHADAQTSAAKDLAEAARLLKSFGLSLNGVDPARFLPASQMPK